MVKLPSKPRARTTVVTAVTIALALVLAVAPACAEATMPALTPANLDTTVAPCRDFYRYANGGWLDRAQIPAAYPSWGGFDELYERNQQVLLAILERAAADAKAGRGAGPQRLIGDAWCACMDSTKADALGTKPIAPRLAEMASLASPDGLAPRVAALHGAAMPTLFAFFSRPDPKKSDQIIAFAGQGGIGLPDRDYYLRTDSAAVETRARYVAYITDSFRALGDDTPVAHGAAERILALETALARASMTNVERRDPHATYHKVAVDSLRRLAPRFDWNRYLAGRGLAGLDSVNVTQPLFFHAVDSLIAAVPLDAWKAYLRWAVIGTAAPDLDRAFVTRAFNFERALTGAEALLPRWKRCIRAIDADLGDALGKVYVEERFPPEAKERALALVRNIEAAMEERIAGLEWMGPETRRLALEKLHAIENKVGYPNTWRDYAGVTLDQGTYFANREAARAWEQRRNLAKIGKPVDRGEWNMTTPVVNAFYSPPFNSINFPAGILQAPFFDPTWDDASNYGAIGMVIGHEISHGFDDRGRQFDAKGNLSDWWTAEDAARYKERANKVVAQFDGYTVLDTLHLNGKLTLGENIADLSGLALAYHGLQRALAGKTVAKIQGYTPEQRFFLAYAQVWREALRPAYLRTQTLTDPHSPGVWRVNGPLGNMPEFAKAFGCTAGDAMVRVPDASVRIW